MSAPVLPLSVNETTVNIVLRSHLGDFSRHGLLFVELTRSGSPDLGVFVTFVFLNRQTGIRMRVAFDEARQGRNGGFSVMLVNAKDEQLNVEDFLTRHGRAAATQSFTYRDTETDVQAFAESFFQGLSKLMNTELRLILEGRTFEATPIDWMGYK